MWPEMERKVSPASGLDAAENAFSLAITQRQFNAGGNRALFRKSFERMVGLCNFVSCLIDDEMGFWRVCLDPGEVSSRFECFELLRNLLRR